MGKAPLPVCFATEATKGADSSLEGLDHRVAIGHVVSNNGEQAFLKIEFFKAVEDGFCEICAGMASTKPNEIQSKTFVMSARDNVDYDAQPRGHVDVRPNVQTEVHNARCILE